MLHCSPFYLFAFPFPPWDFVVMVGSSPLGAGWQRPHFNLPCIVFVFCHIYLTSLQESQDRWILLWIFQPVLGSLQWVWSTSESGPLANHKNSFCRKRKNVANCLCFISDFWNFYNRLYSFMPPLCFCRVLVKVVFISSTGMIGFGSSHNN